jgi:hypothetical protein
MKSNKPTDESLTQEFINIISPVNDLMDKENIKWEWGLYNDNTKCITIKDDFQLWFFFS